MCANQKITSVFTIKIKFNVDSIMISIYNMPKQCFPFLCSNLPKNGQEFLHIQYCTVYQGLKVHIALFTNKEGGCIKRYKLTGQRVARGQATGFVTVSPLCNIFNVGGPGNGHGERRL